MRPWDCGRDRRRKPADCASPPERRARCAAAPRHFLLISFGLRRLGAADGEHVMTAGYHATDRAVLRLGGADARGFLQNLVTNDLDRLDRGAVYAALLSPQGKYLFDFFLLPDGADILIDVAAARAAALAQRLDALPAARGGDDRRHRPRRGARHRRAARRDAGLRRSPAGGAGLAGLHGRAGRAARGDRTARSRGR